MDWENEDGEEHMRYEWLQQEREKNESSYPEGEQHRYCWRCQQLLRFNSMAYDEGFHFDSCE